MIKTLCGWSDKLKKGGTKYPAIQAIQNESILTHEIEGFLIKQLFHIRNWSGTDQELAREDGIGLGHGKQLKIKMIQQQFRLDSTISLL